MSAGPPPAGATSAYLGVTHSALGRRWADRLDARAAREAEAIAAGHGLSETLARVLAGRGNDMLSTPGFLAPRLRDLMPNPSVMADMDKAVERLAAAILRHEAVAIFGDYDVDGACSSALLAGYLRHFDLDPAIHIPDRLTEGYGPNGEAIRALHARGARLLVCLDCGTSGHGPLAGAKALGMDVLVLDHHQADETLPAVDALVNPNRLDDLSGLGTLCAAGVTFLTLVALNRRLRADGLEGPDLLAMLDIVALATVADVMPLTGLNRAFVAQGLKVLRERGRIGLAVLGDVARLEQPPEAWHLGFLYGPRINAGGRIGDAGLGTRLLLADTDEEARRIATELDHLNRERQAVEEGMLAEAEEEALRLVGMAEADRAVIVVAGEGWHPGVVGIVAGRLKERFRRPAFAIAIGEDGQATGSGRSITGVDLGAAIRHAVDAGLIARGGGHAMAGGIGLAATQVEAFAAFLEQTLAASVEAARNADALRIDAALTIETLVPDFVRDLHRAGPFGNGNAEPLLVLPSHRLVEVIELRGGHLKLTITSAGGARAQAMAFKAVGKPLGDALQAGRDRVVHLAVNASLDHWGGRERVSLRIVDLATPVQS